MQNVTDPFVHFLETQRYTHPRKVFTFNPSDDFYVAVAKDDDCNIDVYLHVNPKHLALKIPQMLSCIKRVI